MLLADTTDKRVSNFTLIKGKKKNLKWQITMQLMRVNKVRNFQNDKWNIFKLLFLVVTHKN